MFAKQLKKEGRRNEFERHKLQALNQRQKMVSIANLLDNICYCTLLISLPNLSDHIASLYS